MVMFMNRNTPIQRRGIPEDSNYRRTGFTAFLYGGRLLAYLPSFDSKERTALYWTKIRTCEAPGKRKPPENRRHTGGFPHSSLSAIVVLEKGRPPPSWAPREYIVVQYFPSLDLAYTYSNSTLL
ncbi:hypothetical protein J6590_065816 [Homalodisca vitripennis]|nr:hypothetical protein J6590_065816 [Homalodisca vitripennis]